ncbi:MAG: translocation/assembly module TamB [Treponemataceae bacterium]|nr:translocation/assembly module TamB [Treponemataceae bacterium]
MKYHYLKYGIGSIIFLLMIFAAFMLIRPVYLEINDRLQELKDFAFSYIEDNTGFSIRYDSLSPSILSGIRISGIEVKQLEDDSVVGKIDSVVINYRLLKLFQRDFLGAVRSVSVNGLELLWNEKLTKNIMGLVASVKDSAFDGEEESDSEELEAAPVPEEEESVTSILEDISRFNLPFPVLFRQTSLRYSSGKTVFDIQLDGIKVSEGDGKTTSFTIDLSGRFSLSAPVPEISEEILDDVLPDVLTLTTSLSAQAVVTPELEGSFAKLKLSNSNGNSFSVKGCDFSANLNGDRISCSLFSSGTPFGVTLTHNFSSKKTSVYFNAEDFSPFSFITIKNSNEFLDKFDDIKISGIYGIDFFDAGEALTYNMTGSLALPDGLLPSYLFPAGAKVNADLEGSLESVNVNKLHVSSEMMDVSFFGILDITNLQPDGELYVENYLLPSGLSAQGEFFINPLETGFSLFAPQVYLGSSGLTAVEITCIPGSVSTDFSFSASDYAGGDIPGSIYADGSILYENESFIQAGVSVENLHFSSVFNIINDILPAESALPASVSDFLSPYTVSFNLYGSSDFKSISYNLSNALLLNPSDEKERLSLSLDGNETTAQITNLELSFAGQELTASFSADSNEDYTEVFFSSDIRFNTLPYSVSGVFRQDYLLTVSGDYGLAFNMEFGKDGMLSGTFEALSFPLMISDYIASFDVESDFVFFSADDWHINVSRFSAVENTGKFEIEPGVEFQCYADSYGVIFEQVAYGDNVSALSGTGSLAWDFSDGILANTSLLLNMSNPDSKEALNIDLSGSNPLSLPFSDESFFENFMISGTADITAFPSAKLMSQQEFENTFSASLSVLGSLDNPLVSMEIPRASFKIASSLLEISGRFELEDKIIYCRSFDGSWADLKLRDSSGSFSLTDMEGSVNSVFEANFGSFLNASSPLEFWIKLGKEESEKSFDAGLVFSKIESNILEPINDYKISVSRLDGKTEFTAGQKGLITGSLSDEGELYAKVDGDFPLTFTAGGWFKDNKLDILLASVKCNITIFAPLLPEGGVKFDNGDLSGRVQLGGLLTDPEFSGSLKLDDFSLSIPDFLSDPITSDSLIITAEQNEFSLNDGKISCGKARGEINALLELERWEFSSLSLKFKTLNGNSIVSDIKLPFAEITADVGGEAVLDITTEDISVSGSVGTDNAVFVLTDVTAFSDDALEEGASSAFEYIVDLELLLGPKTEIYYPTKDRPLVRGLVSMQAPVQIGVDTYTDSFSLKGDLSMRGGEILYLNRNFYIREGRIIFNETESNFDPTMTVRAEIRERDADGTLLKISLAAENQRLLSFNPRLTSDPNRSEDDLRKLLGSAILVESGSSATDALGQVAAGGIDFMLQNSLFRQIENQLREFFHFDIFSFRTPFFQHALLQLFRNEATEMNPSNFLDNTTVYIGKYIGADLYLDAMFSLVYTGGSGLDGAKGGLVLQPEIGLELPSPFATIRWSIAPDVTSAQDLWVPNTSISLSWKFSF